MKKLLFATTAIVAFAAQVQFGQAADAGPSGYVDFPTAYISFEAGYDFNASSENVDFEDDDDKLGDLNSLQPGDGGWQGRVALGQRLNEDWDYRVSLSAVVLGADDAQDGEAEASQSASLQTLDLEVGYHPADLGALEARLFAGIRGLHAQSETNWQADSSKLGQFEDRVYALGPRIGMDLAVPLDTHAIALVGSVSGSVLFGSVQSDESYSGGFFDDYDISSSDSQTIWNVEGMAGVSFGIGESADLTLGYRAAQFSGLMVDRSDVDKAGDFSDSGQSDLLLHGPFARLTVEIP